VIPVRASLCRHPSFRRNLSHNQGAPTEGRPYRFIILILLIVGSQLCFNCCVEDFLHSAYVSTDQPHFDAVRVKGRLRENVLNYTSRQSG